MDELHARRTALPVVAEHRDDTAEVVVLDERRARPLLDAGHGRERDHLALLAHDLDLLEVRPVPPLVVPVAQQDRELALVVEAVELVGEPALQRVVGLVGHLADGEARSPGRGRGPPRTWSWGSVCAQEVATWWKPGISSASRRACSPISGQRVEVRPEEDHLDRAPRSTP